MENKGSGTKIGNRCLWDAETDTAAYDNYTSVRKFKKIILNKIVKQWYNYHDKIINLKYIYIKIRVALK